MKPTFFPTPAAFRAWLARHHATAGESLDKLKIRSAQGERLPEFTLEKQGS
jgi:hypothetical protein